MILADNIREIMADEVSKFKMPSIRTDLEYSYDNTGEEAVIYIG
jgi:hypothetical protein